MVDETVIKNLSTNMGITGSGFYIENTLLNSKERYIESSSTKVENENVTFASNFLVETVGNCGSRGLVTVAARWWFGGREEEVGGSPRNKGEGDQKKMNMNHVTDQPVTT